MRTAIAVSACVAVVLLLLHAFVTLPSERKAPRFSAGQVVEFKGLGAKGLVRTVSCERRFCMYYLRLDSGKTEWAYEVELEPSCQPGMPRCL